MAKWLRLHVIRPRSAAVDCDRVPRRYCCKTWFDKALSPRWPQVLASFLIACVIDRKSISRRRTMLRSTILETAEIFNPFLAIFTD
jgi:hypothetical protein